MPEAFHFLRPLWLLALLVPAAVVWILRRRYLAVAAGHGIIAPHLLRHLVVGAEERRWLRPEYVIGLAIALAVTGLAGPTWRKEPPPFAEDKAALAIVLNVSRAMLASDLKPSRLERAKQKVRDLLARREGAKSGLIAFAGTAHVVMPPTDDPRVIEPFLEALTPELMPRDGNEAGTAAALAATMMAADLAGSTVLLVTDAVPSGTLDGTVRRIVIWAMRASRDGDPIATGHDADVVWATPDRSDVDAVERRIATNFVAAQADNPESRWLDEGYWLILPAALIACLWFRRGFAVHLALAALVTMAPAAHAEGFRFADLWLTRDQQGRIALDRGDHAAAARLFADPFWRGVAYYRGNDFFEAGRAFAAVPTRAGMLAFANAQARNHQWEKAIAAYRKLIAEDPDDRAARTNLAIVQAIFDTLEAERRNNEQDDQAPPDLPADETRVDPQQQGGKRIEVQPGDVTTEAAAQAWMRSVQTRPAAFLRAKFAIQSQAPAARP